MNKLSKRLVPGFLAVLFCLISLVALVSMLRMQGNARVVNYTGIVRGATQRLVKQEINGLANDGLIRFLDGTIAELSSGQGDNHLIALPDAGFQQLMAKMRLSWDQLKAEIEEVRRGGDTQRLFALSERYFELADQTVSAAERYCEKQVRNAIQVLISLNVGFVVLFILLWVSGRRQKKVQLALERAQSASRAKSEFLSRMSHEIRTPMNGITGMTAIARRSCHNPERLMDCLNKIDLSSAYLLSLLNDILDMSRIESGKIELERRAFDLTEVFDSIYGMFRQKAEENGVVFQIVQDLSVTVVVGDSLRLSQVLVNLVSNAMKFTPSGGSVTLTGRQKEAAEGAVALEFTVADTGVGISEEFQAHLFEPFEQEQSATCRQYGGTGLGLAITSSFVKLMGGDICVESQPGQGSRFTVRLTLPRPSPEEAEQLVRASANRREGEKQHIHDLNGVHILLAEDNEINAEIMTCLLEDKGALVQRVGDGRAAVEALSSAAAGAFALVLMDVQMPVMDGVEATRAIRGLDHPDAKRIPIIGLSANAFREDIEYALKNGMNGYLAKPIDLDRLYQMLDELIFTKAA